MEYTLNKFHKTNIYHFETNQFKTSSICLVMNIPLNEEDYLHSLILKRILLKKTKNYSSPKILSDKLRDLYDMKIDFDNLSSGDLETLRLRVSFVDNYYLDGNINLEVEAFESLKEILLNPYLGEDGLFDKEDLEIEKRSIIDEINNVYNHKMAYSLRQLTHILYHQTNSEILLGDNVDKIKKINKVSLYTFYQKLLKESSLYFITMGKINQISFSKMANILIEENFKKNFENNYSHIKVVSLTHHQSPKLLTIESAKTNQSVLAMGFTSDILLYDDEYPAMLVANGMFGGYFHSKLFQIIREKYNLSYAISSYYNAMNGSIMVVAGLDKSNMYKAQDLVLEILDSFKNNFNDMENFELTKITLINELLQSEDSRYTQLLLLKNNIDFKDRFITNKELINKIKHMDINNVIEVFNKIKFMHTYFLEGMIDDEDK